jgi:hypothetical protein
MLLAAYAVIMHPYVLGEIALGSPANRAAWIKNLGSLPRAVVASPDEVLALIENESIFGTGIGYVDAHLLASTRLTPAARLLTRDKRLHALALQLGIAAPTP